MNKIYVYNHDIPRLTSNIAHWHDDRNLIDGATDLSQTEKLLEEFTELVASLYPDKDKDFIYDEIVSMLDRLHAKDRIKPVTEANASSAKFDSIGDMYVVLVNIAERNRISMQNCINNAWIEIKDRRGRMINGQFVKEEDLPDGNN
jgi:uncharacterized protein YabN with tetrapyrrole methylase and pyrophosphatase domain